MHEREPGALEPWIVQADAKPWKAFADAPGVEYRVLRKHPEGGGLTLMLRFARGVRYPAHRHPGGEEYYVLEGDLKDGGRTYGRGAFVWHPPMSVHAPASPGGCELIVVLPKAIEIVGGAAPA